MSQRKFYSKWFKDFNVKLGILSLLEGKVDNMLEWIDVEKNFQNRTPGVKTLRPTLDKQDRMKLKCFYVTKKIKEEKAYKMGGVTSYISGRWLVSVIHKKPKHQENKQSS